MRSSKQIFSNSFKDEMKNTRTNDPETLKTASEIGDFKEENNKNYSGSKKVKQKNKGENKEATTTSSSGSGIFAPLQIKETPMTEDSIGSVGSYETPAMWAKSTNPKDWSARKYMPGAKRVSIKKRCKTFPYCNQGDINALKIYENKEIKEAIENVSKNLGISESVIKSILEYEIEKLGMIKSLI